MKRKSSAAPPLVVGCLGLIATAVFAVSNPLDSSAGIEADQTKSPVVATIEEARATPAPAPIAPPVPTKPPAPTKDQLAACQTGLDKAVADDPLTFPEEQATLTQSTQKTLAKLAGIVQETCSGARMEISGHTDGTGRKDKNLALSQDRADAVKNYLVDRGLSAAALTAIGFGSQRRVATDKTPAGRAKNRRIEFRMVSGD